jgi:hypothetical protein
MNRLRQTRTTSAALQSPVLVVSGRPQESSQAFHAPLALAWYECPCCQGRHGYAPPEPIPYNCGTPGKM